MCLNANGACSHYNFSLATPNDNPLKLDKTRAIRQ